MDVFGLPSGRSACPVDEAPAETRLSNTFPLAKGPHPPGASRLPPSASASLAVTVQRVRSRLPKILQWFSGNIGFHHIHHLSSRIPNYNLEKCHRAEPLFQTVKPVTLVASFKALTFRLWDEQRHKLVGFRVVKTRSPGAGRRIWRSIARFFFAPANNTRAGT